MDWGFFNAGGWPPPSAIEFKYVIVVAGLLTSNIDIEFEPEFVT